MTALSVPVPESLIPLLEDQAAARGYRDAGEYVLALIRQALAAEERAAIDAKLLVGVEAMERGDVSELTSDDWDRLRERIRGE